MDKEILKELISQGLSSREIGDKFGKSQSTIQFWLRKFDLKTHPDLSRINKEKKFREPIKYSRKPRRQYDYHLIQESLDSGLTWREVSDKFNISQNTLNRANKKGLIKSRNRREALILSLKTKPRPKHSQQTKDKISKIRREFLEKNPDKVPYLINHSSKESYPEKIFKEALIKNNILGWTDSYQHGIYEYDFAFVDLKIDVEIDGDTHKTEKVIKIDKRRDSWSISKGWHVIRFTTQEVRKNLDECIIKLKEFIASFPVAQPNGPDF